MAGSKNCFYVTTPIYYVTAQPHVGSLYTTIMADAVAKYHRLMGNEVFFLTGTDEHGNKIAQAAAVGGMEPLQFVHQVAQSYKKMWDLYDIEYSDFIRTTEERHKKAVYALIEKATANGDIYKSFYEGWYCQPDEAFVAEKSAVEGNQPPICPTCGRPTILISEESYFFCLSAYQDKLLKFYKENPDFIVPKERINEIISFVESGLKDLSISRTTVKWGIPFPGDPKHVLYVWIDALSNYLSAIGYGQPGREKEFKKWWPADVQLMGKEITRFHAVYWPAFLMAAGLPLPKRLLVHGWITVDGKKMSKSFGNVVDPQLLYDAYGVEQVKYYLLRHLPVNQDGDFSYAGLEQCITSDLADGLGNLLNRMVALAQKNGISEIVPPAKWGDAEKELQKEAVDTIAEYHEHWKDYAFHLALARLWKLVNASNAFFHSQEPWKLAKNDPEKFMSVLSATCHSLRSIAILLWPIMPRKMEELLASIGVSLKLDSKPMGGIELDKWDATFAVNQIPTLFQKIEPKKKGENVMEKTEKEPKSNEISIDDFTKVELVVGTVTDAQEIEKSDKLLKLTVDFGPLGQRTILAGIKKWYKPSDIIEKQAVFVFNLKPRELMGHTSQGMLMMGSDETGKPQPMFPAAKVPNGTRLR